MSLGFVDAILVALQFAAFMGIMVLLYVSSASIEMKLISGFGFLAFGTVGLTIFFPAFYVSGWMVALGRAFVAHVDIVEVEDMGGALYFSMKKKSGEQLDKRVVGKLVVLRGRTGDTGRAGDGKQSFRP